MKQRERLSKLNDYDVCLFFSFGALQPLFAEYPRKRERDRAKAAVVVVVVVSLLLMTHSCTCAHAPLIRQSRVDAI